MRREKMTPVLHCVRNDNNAGHLKKRAKISLVFTMILLSAVQIFSQDNILPGTIAGSLQPSSIQNWVLVIHGGAGGGPQGSMPAEKEQQYREKLSEALETGSVILAAGGSSLDAVEAAVAFMEDCPLFNAGKGAVYNRDGVAELDASIMDGQTLQAGAVAGVKTIRHPVSAARLVMAKTPHVLLIGEGAEEFAKEQGLEIVDPSWFLTPERNKQFERIRMKPQENQEEKAPPEKQSPEDKDHGTVGAVALDRQGNLAAATSTGGLMFKMKGRVGDTPVIGAGTYASNATCAVSCTGTGEFFIRNSIAFQVSSLMECRGMGLEEAANLLITEVLRSQGGDGGLIAVDRNGNIAMPFNTNAMFRGYAKQDGAKEVMVY
jgi:beta-aspartyl-peptidase (threonine type)